MANMYEMERKIGQFMRRNVGNLALTTIGVGIAVGFYADEQVALNQDNDLNRAYRQEHALAERLRQEYQVYTVCISGGGEWGGTVCSPAIRGDYSYKERNEILKEFYEKLKVGKKEIFASIDEEVIKEAVTMGFIRLGGVFFGLIIAATGLGGIKTKEENGKRR